MKVQITDQFNNLLPFGIIKEFPPLFQIIKESPPLFHIIKEYPPFSEHKCLTITKPNFLEGLTKSFDRVSAARSGGVSRSDCRHVTKITTPYELRALIWD